MRSPPVSNFHIGAAVTDPVGVTAAPAERRERPCAPAATRVRMTYYTDFEVMRAQYVERPV